MAGDAAVVTVHQEIADAREAANKWALELSRNQNAMDAARSMCSEAMSVHVEASEEVVQV